MKKGKGTPSYSEEETRDLNVRLPQRLAERIEAYARQNDAEVSQVVIEAVDWK